MRLYKLYPGSILAVGDPDEQGLLPIRRFDLDAVPGWPDDLALARTYVAQQLVDDPEPFRPAAGTLAPLPPIDAYIDQAAWLRAKFRRIPGWATYTVEEATGWIDQNVTDLPSAKTALKALARMTIYLRDLNLEDQW